MLCILPNTGADAQETIKNTVPKIGLNCITSPVSPSTMQISIESLKLQYKLQGTCKP